uniref:Uncharacterized protein n=1 Tax=Timema monikensis TaxID=170555 RepID=A0A7R9E411_9NEOP|nr:unnamed protein product [Timema monikensis]
MSPAISPADTREFLYGRNVGLFCLYSNQSLSTNVTRDECRWPIPMFLQTQYQQQSSRAGGKVKETNIAHAQLPDSTLDTLIAVRSIQETDNHISKLCDSKKTDVCDDLSLASSPTQAECQYMNLPDQSSANNITIFNCSPPLSHLMDGCSVLRQVLGQYWTSRLVLVYRIFNQLLDSDYLPGNHPVSHNSRHQLPAVAPRPRGAVTRPTSLDIYSLRRSKKLIPAETIEVNITASRTKEELFTGLFLGEVTF